MKNKILIILLVALVISIGVYYYMKKKNAQKVGGGSSPYIAPGSGTTTPNTYQAAQTSAPVTIQPQSVFPLKFGSRGKAVQFLQVVVGVKPDGTWGNTTDIALKSKLQKFMSVDNAIDVQEFLEIASAGLGSQDWPLRNGSNSVYVKGLQIMVNAPVASIDGKFGPNTAALVTKVLGHATCSQAEFVELVKRSLNI